MGGGKKLNKRTVNGGDYISPIVPLYRACAWQARSRRGSVLSKEAEDEVIEDIGGMMKAVEGAGQVAAPGGLRGR